jgi:prepilin-type N-terminal cleavage/methylation domain-containing protein
MKRILPGTRGARRAFTLIELLTVIAVIAVLAGLLAVSLATAKTNTKKKLTQLEEVSIVAAVAAYQADYSRLPASSLAVAAAGKGDFTFGTVSNTPNGQGSLSPTVIDTPGENQYQNYNSEVIAILRDDNVWPESANGVQHVYNPKQHPYLDGAKMAMDTNSPGIGPDDVMRDLWGNPYIITLDLNYDNKSYDANLDTMYQLGNPNPPGPLLVPKPAVVWSFGPSKTINLTQPLNSAANKKTIIYSF